MATIAQQKMRIIRIPKKTESFPEASGQSFEAGEFVYMTSGGLTVCADDAQTILGVSLEPASGVTGTLRSVALADDDLLLEMNCYKASSAVTAWTDVEGGPYAAELDGHKWYCATDDTSHDALQVVRLSPKDTVGDTYGRLICRVIPSARQPKIA